MADHVFISHASEDHDFVLPLAAALKARGVPVWIDNWDIPPGANWELTVEDALYACARFLIVLSPAAVRSPEVRGELRTALNENKLVLPLLCQECRIPYRLHAIQYVDFQGRDPDDEAVLADVLRALGVQEPTVRAPGDAVERAHRVPAAPKTSPVAEGRKLPAILTPRQPYEPEMVLIPAGEFLMGSDPAKDEGADDDEQPQHTLTLPDYYLARTPVTNAQYLAYVQATGQGAPEHWQGGRPPRGKEDHPVVNVTWHDAMAYCRWLEERLQVPGSTLNVWREGQLETLNLKPGTFAVRLPSEAEWEKGARGTDGRIYPWGNSWDAARCNSSEGGKGDTTPVDAYPNGASPYGLLDMAGNVWEWTRTLWGSGYPYDPSDGREDLEAAGARVVRGGAFYYDARGVRCAFRSRLLPDLWDWVGGLRVVVGPGLPL